MERTNTIKVAGVGKLNVAPDYSRTRIEVSRVFAGNDEAYEKGKQNISAINAALKSVGLDAMLAKTHTFDVSENSKPVYEKNKFIGYEKNGYSLRLIVFIEMPIDNTILNRLTKEIYENVEYAEVKIDTFVFNPREHRLKALSHAVEDAKEKAEIIASALGCSLGEIVNVNYGNVDIDSYSQICDCQSLSRSGAALEMTGEDMEVEESVIIIWQLKNP